MQFAKLRSHARYTLGASGVANLPFSELEIPADETLELHGPNSYGYPRLLEAIASYTGVSPEMVAHAAGTSEANHLAFAVTVEPGDDVLVEEPTYELILTALRFLGANIRRFPRRRENGFHIDARDVERAMTPKTRLIVVCNLHNPTSVREDDATIRELGEIAVRHGARVLVDEVYLELFAPGRTTAATFGPQFLVTSSLTKAYGLSGLRCGWVLCDPEIAHRIYLLRDLFEGVGPFLMDCYSVIAFRQLERIRARAQALIAANRPRVLELLAAHSDILECVVPEVGTTLAPRLTHGSADSFCDFVRQRCQASVVPGRFFEMPEHFRIGLAADPEMTREGVALLDEALTEWRRR
jgi:aspartate/methionine/tyrosine aminotransferase